MDTRPWKLIPREGLSSTALGLYVHVPFCARRCGYCAFNTYVSSEMSDSAHDNFVAGAVAEIALASTSIAAQSGQVNAPKLTSIYFGGGTPTILRVDQIETILNAARHYFDVTEVVEVTVESNPDGIDSRYLTDLFRIGVNRISFGMQSTSARVLALLDRTHSPRRALVSVAEAHAAGFEHVSLDLIFGTPGERPEDFEQSLDAAISAGVDHISAYALGIEPRTKLAARVRNGSLPSPSDDEAADRYLTAENRLSAAGFDWYEISNWSRTPEGRSRHNLLYWRNENWWGIGPGAHSHLDGVRWWNENDPDAWAAHITSSADRQTLPEGLDQCHADASHVAGYEKISPAERRFENVMLGIRTATGLLRGSLDAPLDSEVILKLIDEGLLRSDDNRVALTLQGRLLADHVVSRLT